MWCPIPFMNISKIALRYISFTLTSLSFLFFHPFSRREEEYLIYFNIIIF
jgi:hypothetical protein